MTDPPHAIPYGAWPSPITAESLVAGAVGISEVHAGADGTVWWGESRPDEGGRTAVMRCRPGGETEEVTPPAANVRTLVHEYGGGAWWVGPGPDATGEVLYWVDFADQRLRRTDPRGDVTVLTAEPTRARALRYADGRATPDGRWVVCVREHHPDEGEVVNGLVAVATDGSGRVEELWRGADFVSSPRIAPDGGRLAWISWDHPEMPWTRTRLHVHELDDGRLGRELLAVGGDVAFCEPGWVGDAVHVCADPDGWWNLHAVDLASGALSPVVSGPFEIATPPWVFGMQRWAAVGEPASFVAVAGLPTGDEWVVGGRTTTTVDSAVTSVSAAGPALAWAGAGYDHETEVLRGTVDGGTLRREVVRPARDLPFPSGFLVEPEWITFPTGPDPTAAGAPVAHALYYPPTHPTVVGPSGERPPLLVLAHGGPTAQARRQLQTAILYWTSRGIAVVDVDYRGSTGYGRDYRRSLDGVWGVADVEDCVAAARFLAGRGEVDPDRLMIRGGSAGGFTVLAALAFHDVFAVGASRYGVADLTALATDTHKFESRYLDSLVGPYPEARAVYEARSPIHHVDRLEAPMIVLQGDEDEVVPPDQSEMIVAALEAKGVPVAYLLFHGEQHGFRRADTIVAALEAELAFFGEMLGFEPADDLTPIEIRRPGDG